MHELILAVKGSHPAAAFVRRHPSARVTLYIEEVRGATVTQHVVQASRALQQAYLEDFQNLPGANRCEPLIVSQESGNILSAVHGPCSCGGGRGMCAALTQLHDVVAAHVAGRSRITEIVFERGRTVAKAVHSSNNAPIVVALTTPEHVVRVLATKRIVRHAQGDFLSRKLDPSEAETLRVALRLGYYEKPRRCTMEDIAAELSITKSAVCHRLNKLEQKAVRDLFQASSSAGFDADDGITLLAEGRSA